MVTQRDTQRRAQPQGQKEQELRMRPAPRQLIGVPDPRPQQPVEFIPREFLPALRAATRAEPQAVAPQAAPQAEPQAEPQVTPQQDAGVTPSATSARYDPNNPYVAEAMRLEEKYNLPKGVFLALVQQESGFNPNAVSKAGAYGLAQLMPGTASGLNVDPRDPMQNLDGGARYLAEQIATFGDLSKGLAAYNAGPGAVRKAGNAIPNFPETQKYVAAVMRNAGYPMAPPKLADGGLIELARKYADGGSVSRAAQVYDPAVIAAIVASITEPQGYAEGGRAASKKKKQNRPLSLDLSDSSYDGYKPYPINTPDPKKWSPAPVPERNDQDSAASSSLTKTGKGAFWEGLGKASPELALGMGSGEMGQGEVDAGESSAEGDNDALGFKIRGNVGKLGSSPYVNIGGGMTLPLGDVMLMLDASYGKAIGYSAKPDISVTGGVRIPFAEGGTATGVSSDDATPRTFADLVRRYAVGDAMQMGAPLDDPSLGANVSQSIGDYFRPVGQGLLEIPGTLKKYAIDVATDPKPFTRLGSDISTLGSAVWEGVKNDPVGTVLDILPVVGEVRSGMDAHEFRNKADAAERAGDEKQAAVYRQLSAVGMVGAIPLVGMASRAANRGVKLGVEGAEAAARVGLDAVAVVPRELSPLGFYSHGAETAANLSQAKGTPDQMAAMLRRYGVKPDEFYNTGIADETATNVMRSKIERDYAPKLAAAKLEMDALGLNENTINKKSPDYNRALEIRDSPETKAKYQYDRTLSAMRSEMDSAMVLRPEWASRPSVTREELAQHFSERRPQIEETVLGGRGKPEMNDAAKQEWIENAAAERAYNSGDLDEIRNWRNVSDDVRTWHLDNATSAFNEQMAISPAFASQFQTIGKEGATKFQEYTLPGGENYREVLLRFPNSWEPKIQEKYGRFGFEGPDGKYRDYWTKVDAEQAARSFRRNSGDFTSSHWDDPNVLAHLRMSDRTGPNGEKILHLEELQSDWGQKGRTEGFKGEVEQQMLVALQASRQTVQNVTETFDRLIANGLTEHQARIHPEFIAAYDQALAANKAYGDLNFKSKSTIPTAPYVTNTAAWTDLALKRALKEAAEGGYDRIVWTPGAEQAKRYSLRSQVDEIRYIKNDDGTYNVIPFRDGDALHNIQKENIPDKELESFFGRDVAEKMRAYEGDVRGNVRSLSGQNLEVGGEGMKAYYDKMVPNQLSKLVKRLDPDAKVGLTDVMLPQGTGPGMGHNNPPFEAPGLTITPKMREAIMKGQTDFAEGGHVQGYADGGSADNSLAALYEKYHAEPTTRISYAQGGSVDSAPVYDPAVIAAIAASITEDDHA